MSDSGEITQLLLAYRDGNGAAFDELVGLVYQDLRRIAHAHLRSNRNRSLNTTALVHEAYLRLVDQTQVPWEDRQHFLSVCARAMRQIVISDARRRHAAKRGGKEHPDTLNEERISGQADAEQLIAIDQALERLAAKDARMVRVFECRYFAGMTEQETVEATGLALRTVQRDWMRARAWLREELS